MGLTESKPETIKTSRLIKPEDTLPSFSLEAAKFAEGSGFIVTATDLAKNSLTRTIKVKFVMSPYENCFVFVGTDESILSFVKDRLSGKVACSISSSMGSKENIIRFCTETYDPIDDEVVDKIKALFPEPSLEVSEVKLS